MNTLGFSQIRLYTIYEFIYIYIYIYNELTLHVLFLFNINQLNNMPTRFAELLYISTQN